MKTNIKIIVVLIISPILYILFNIVEFEPLNQLTSKYFQSLLFVFTFMIVTIKPIFRTKIVYFSLFILLIMAGTYILQKIALANSLASIGFGLLFITLTSYLPELVKKGVVEKL